MLTFLYLQKNVLLLSFLATFPPNDFTSVSYLTTHLTLEFGNYYFKKDHEHVSEEFFLVSVGMWLSFSLDRLYTCFYFLFVYLF